MSALHRRAVLTALLAAALSACGNKKTDDGTRPVTPGSLPALSIRDDTPDLMLTWIDDKGDTHVELHPADVPAAGRALVRVIVSTSENGTRDLFYVVDLNKREGDGSFAAQVMARRAWEEQIEKRREAYLAKIAPPPPPANGSAAPSAPDKIGAPVIIYGASWCGPCHEAAEYLKKKGVPYVMKDVETTPGAAAEMREKLTSAGRSGGSIPVIDVRGQIIVGYSPHALDQALAKAAKGTTL